MSSALKAAPRSTQPPALKPIDRYSDRMQRLMWLGNVELIFSREPPTREFMKRIVDELDTLANVCGCGAGALLVIRSDCPAPSEEARTYIKKELARSSMLAAAQVVTGRGFVGAALRSALSLLQLLSRPPYPMKVFADVTTASAWLTQELTSRAGQAPPERDLAFVASDVERRFLNAVAPPNELRR